MTLETIGSNGFSDLKDLATWLYDEAKMETQERNISRCVDDLRTSKVRPLLEHLKIDIIEVRLVLKIASLCTTNDSKGHRYGLLRITGEAIIKETDAYGSVLFFPLSIGSGRESIASGQLQVAGETMKPGTYIKLTSNLRLNQQLDCLLVLLP